MEHNVGVGAIIGFALASSIYVWNNKKFSSIQKTILLICIVFPPAQWIGILVVLAYNSNIENNTVERKLDSTISSLIELKNKGILTEEEFNTKVDKIEVEKSEQNLKNSFEYKQLKSLLDNEILTKEEFESKIDLLQNIYNKITINKTATIFTYKIDNNIENEKSIPNYTRKIKIKDGTELTVQSYFTSGLREGDKVFINNHPASNGKYKLGWLDYITIENGKIK